VSPRSISPVQGFHPSHGLGVAHLSRIPLDRCEVGVPKDDLGNDLVGDPEPKVARDAAGREG